MKCVLLNIKNVTCDKKRYNVTSPSRVGGINMFSFSMRFVVFSRFQSSDFPIECHVTDILRHRTGVNARRRRIMRQGDTGTISGEATPATGQKEPLLRLCRVIIIRRMCLLVSCPRHHATCRLLQTHCRLMSACVF